MFLFLTSWKMVPPQPQWWSDIVGDLILSLCFILRPLSLVLSRCITEKSLGPFSSHHLSCKQILLVHGQFCVHQNSSICSLSLQNCCPADWFPQYIVAWSCYSSPNQAVSPSRYLFTLCLLRCTISIAPWTFRLSWSTNYDDQQQTMMSTRRYFCSSLSWLNRTQ